MSNEIKESHTDGPSHSTECPICQDTLGPSTETFVRCDEDTEVSEAVFRLECGHAFHTHCLIRSLRVSKGCPVCRKVVHGSEERNEGRAIDANIVVNMDGSITLQFNEERETEEMDINNQIRDLLESQVESATSLIDVLETVRRQPNIQLVRARSNRVYRSYRAFETHLMQKRKEMLDEAMSEFRRSYLEPFHAVYRSMKRALRKVKMAEETAIRAQWPERAETILQNLRQLTGEYTVEGHVGNMGLFGPLRRRFWHGSS